eukprot:gnl/TRDRNA2_/TRDRNA2_36124_c0_seq1.p1 gnl/TRDRNA2_/TRDRNA2_36124_c0~~gnl/TRDRNA2_/TRDRNA2_36124_c0_seq1.p1  ORF type:complete len:141 (+),score=24.07 gnl/TRDRNA2_/TRDRNA2_36124_c0_seq1:129-551(+)
MRTQMMRAASMVVLLAFLTQVHSEEMAMNNNQQLVDRALRASGFHDELDSTLFGKAGLPSSSAIQGDCNGCTLQDGIAAGRRMPSHKTFQVKMKLARAAKKNRNVPQWIRMKPGNTQKYNKYRRHWRRTKLGMPSASNTR